ncbi:MAG: SpoIIE family protein phosphatase [Bacteroidales bacterium]|nr:SpoIIE family protein phosphatase [Bacteroidales bacterium]
MKKIVLYILILGVHLSLLGQNYKFKKFGIQEGICHPFIYTINQDKNGFIWMGTGEGLCKFNGFNFYSVTPDDSISGVIVNVIKKDKNQNLWFGYNDGTTLVYDGTEFQRITFSGNISGAITDIIQLPGMNILIATQNNGVWIVDNNFSAKAIKGIPDENILTSLGCNESHLLVGCQEGLFVYTLPDDKDSVLFLSEIQEFSYTKIQSLQKRNNSNSFWMATEDEGPYLLEFDENKYKAKKIGDKFNLGNENVQHIFEDRNSNIWLSTLMHGLVYLSSPNTNGEFTKIIKYNNENGLGINFIKQVFEDYEGNIWIATYGEGLLNLIDQAFVFYNFPQEPIKNNILAISGNDSIVWIGGVSGIIKTTFIDGSFQKVFSQANGLPNDQVTALFFDQPNDILWIGTNNNGLYSLNLKNEKIAKFYHAPNNLGNSINSLTSDGENVYLATKDGIHIIQINTKKHYHYTTLNGVPHNDIEQIFLNSENRLVFATRSNGLYEIDERGEVNSYLRAGNIELEFNSITQDYSGKFWASTYGSGVFYFLTDTVINITARQGLKSNYCYSIIAADSTGIWVGHRLGLSRINVDDYSVKVYDVNLGITGDCNLNSVYKDQSGTIYFGTTDGLIRYQSNKDRENVIAPQTNITRIIISDKEYPVKKEIVLPYSAYKIRFEFLGLSYRNPEGVSYKYKLEGYDLDWSDITRQNFALYPRVEDGDYTFKLIAFNENGIAIEAPVELKLSIKLPFWKTWWFITLFVLFLIILVFTIIKIRERKQRQLQEYLETKLEERTREVVEQKEEIEIKNKDITDSINYAQRIQSSILPPIQKLHQNFSGSFVFYQPRDIVSGDFYWFDKVDNNKFVIVCADSTGHGVPGAFMSMIGTTLIKDIIMRGNVQSPSEILRSLDHELRITLNQNVEAEKSNDGMDIIVCEVNIQTNYLRYASAMRPMIIYKDNELLYVKGSRSSVGGHYDKEDKIFQDSGLQLSKGDILYMFSDGYPDQFGGPMGKKFKMVRLKNLLIDIHGKPMEEQYNYVKSSFNLWKENHEQVDDVLFMGLKL